MMRSVSAFAGSSSAEPYGIAQGRPQEEFEFGRDVANRRSLPSMGEDLTGHTAAEAKGMTPEEREKMLYKRRIRNRESAARTREKRKVSLHSIQAECDELNQRMAELGERVQQVIDLNSVLHRENQRLQAELYQIRGGRDPGPQIDPQQGAFSPEGHPGQRFSLREAGGLPAGMEHGSGLPEDPHAASGVVEDQPGTGMTPEMGKEEDPEHAPGYPPDRSKQL
jgi:bZIP transcription factor